MKSIITSFLLILTTQVGAQKKKVYLPAWTFQQRNAAIYGLSFGLWNFSDSIRNTATNGIRFSLIGEGILVGFVPESPVFDNDSSLTEMEKDVPTEVINGINISGTGIAGTYLVNGISIGLVGHLTRKTNGLSASTLNFSQIHNGIQFSIFVNECYRMNGMQIGILNKSRQTRGIQIGLWNVNERRKLPLINWNFRRKNSNRTTFENSQYKTAQKCKKIKL